MSVARIGEIEVAHDLAFERRSWLFQRIGWALMAAVVLAARQASPATGRRPAGKATAQGAGSPSGSRRR